MPAAAPERAPNLVSTTRARGRREALPWSRTASSSRCWPGSRGSPAEPARPSGSGDARPGWRTAPPAPRTGRCARQPRRGRSTGGERGGVRRPGPSPLRRRSPGARRHRRDRRPTRRRSGHRRSRRERRQDRGTGRRSVPAPASRLTRRPERDARALRLKPPPRNRMHPRRFRTPRRCSCPHVQVIHRRIRRRVRLEHIARWRRIRDLSNLAPRLEGAGRPHPRVRPRCPARRHGHRLDQTTDLRGAVRQRVVRAPRHRRARPARRGRPGTLSGTLDRLGPTVTGRAATGKGGTARDWTSTVLPSSPGFRNQTGDIVSPSPLRTAPDRRPLISA